MEATENTERTELEALLLEIVTGSDKPLSRSDIAKRINRSTGKLTSYDNDLLHALADEGLIIARKERIGAVQKQWVYEGA